MTPIIVVAGATGRLGRRIVAALRRHGAPTRALVRPGTAADKRQTLEETGAEVAEVDFLKGTHLPDALTDVRVVVSALNGLHDVIVEAQKTLLEAAVSAGVERFIPSDYAADYTKLNVGENRNFDLRREFRGHLLAAPIQSTSVLNGMFMDILLYGTPMLDLRRRTVTYFGDPDQLLDFTTMDNAAEVTARTALDPNSPSIIRVAGDQVSARGLAAVGEATSGYTFELTRRGSLDDLVAAISAERAAHPETEGEEFPRWQQMQYQHNMFSGRAKLRPVDNARFPDFSFTTVRDLLAKAVASRDGGVLGVG